MTKLKLYFPIIFIVMLFVGWLTIAFTMDYFLIVLYPLYTSFLIAALYIIKHKDTNLKELNKNELKTGIRTFGIGLGFVIVLTHILKIKEIFTLGIMVLFYLFILLMILQLTLFILEYKKRPFNV